MIIILIISLSEAELIAEAGTILVKVVLRSRRLTVTFRFTSFPTLLLPWTSYR